MWRKRKKPEFMEPEEESPEFILVSFDENGRPIDVRPAKPPEEPPEEDPAPVIQKKEPVLLANGGIESLNEEVKRFNFILKKTTEDVAKLANQPQINSFLLNSIKPIKERVENLEKQANTKNNFILEIEKTFENMKISIDELSKKTEQLNLDSKFKEKLEEINFKVSNFSKELADIKAYITSTFDQLSQNQDEISRINGEIFSLKSAILTNQEKIIKEILNELTLKIQKAKKKKKITKPTKAKVKRFLKNNLNIEPTTKVLILADKKNYIFGKTIYEAMKSMSKYTIFTLAENGKEKADLDEPITEAIKQSDYAIILGRNSSQKARKLVGSLPYNVKLISIKRTLRYSVLN